MELDFFRAGPEHAKAFLDHERLSGDPRIYGPVTDIAAALHEIQENRLYLIRSGDDIVGSAAYRRRPDGSVHISSVAVHPSYRRRGIARSAMQFLLECAGDARRIDLVTHPENEAALALYLSLGFSIDTRVEDYYGDGEPRLVLVLDRA